MPIATEHATGPYELWLQRTAAELICEVHDYDPQLPQRPLPSSAVPFAPAPQSRGGGLDALRMLLSERGRGLQIVDHLSKGCWGFRLPGNGKKIAWVAIATGSPSRTMSRMDGSSDRIPNQEAGGEREL